MRNDTDLASSLLDWRALGKESARQLRADLARLTSLLDARSAGKPNSNVIQFRNYVRHEAPQTLCVGDTKRGEVLPFQSAKQRDQDGRDKSASTSSRSTREPAKRGKGRIIGDFFRSDAGLCGASFPSLLGEDARGDKWQGVPASRMETLQS